MPSSSGSDVRLVRRSWKDPRESVSVEVRHLGIEGDDNWLLQAGGTPLLDAGGEHLHTSFAPVLFLVRPGAWWLGEFSHVRWKIHACGPILYDPPTDLVEFRDLYLDVEGPPGGPAITTDEDEFDAAVDALTPEEAGSARETVDWALRTLSERLAPFDGQLSKWLDHLGEARDSLSLHTAVMRFSPHHAARARKQFGAALIDSWASRQEAGQGQLLVVERGDAFGWTHDAGLGWASRPGASAPPSQLLELAPELLGTPVATMLSDLVTEIGSGLPPRAGRSLMEPS
jgi:hypothetical protein